MPEFLIEPYDHDVLALPPEERQTALDAMCACGHRRRDHFGATGAIASFGGTACERCWTCATFRKED